MVVHLRGSHNKSGRGFNFHSCYSIDAVVENMSGPTLEELLMRRYSVKHVAARRLVDDARRTLGMTRAQPWTIDLQEECEKRLNADTDFIRTATSVPVSSASKSSMFVSHFRTSIVVDTIDEGMEKPVPRLGAREIRKVKHSSPHGYTETVPSVTRAWQAHSSRRVVVKQVPLKPDVGSSCKVVALMTGVSASKRYPVKTSIIVEENSNRTMEDDTDDSSGHAEEKTPAMEVRAGVDVDMVFDEKTEAELIADDCSQATDNSKCFTTAKELGIEDDDSAADPEMPTHPNNEATQPLLDKVPSSSHVSGQGEESTVGTSSVSEVGVPLVIFLRFDLPPEVPASEPLAQCYNLALPVYTRRQRLRAHILKSWRRLTGFKPRNKVRLNDDDTEVRVQTLVDL